MASTRGVINEGLRFGNHVALDFSLANRCYILVPGIPSRNAAKIGFFFCLESSFVRTCFVYQDNSNSWIPWVEEITQIWEKSLLVVRYISYT